MRGLRSVCVWVRRSFGWHSGPGCPDAMKPGIHGARTHWIRGFMAFHRSGAAARTGESERGRRAQAGGGARDGAGGNQSCTEITAVPTRAPGTEHASQTSHLVWVTQPGGDRPPPASSSVKEKKHLMLARHRQSLILQAVRSDGS